jgi:hypothetical protein
MEQSVVAEIRTQAEGGRLAEDLSIVYRIRGGSPGESVDETVALNGSGAVRVVVRDSLGGAPEGDVRDELGEKAVVELSVLLERGVEGLIPQSDARFLPDSLVGSIQVGLGDRSETYYFHADEGQRDQANAPALSQETTELLSRFDEIASSRLPRRSGQ